MAKRKKKNAITMVSLLLVLVVLIGVYIWYSNTKATDKKDKESTIHLATVKADKVTAIHFTGSDVDMNLVLENGVWKSKEEPDRPINQDNVKNMLTTIKKITATKKVIDKPDNLADYGLEKPAAYIQVTQKDGSIVTLQLGNESAIQDGYYALVNDSTTVYLVDSSYQTGLNYKNTDMTAIEKAPTIAAENLNAIRIDKRKGEDFDIQLGDQSAVDNSGATLYQWQYVKPYGKGYTVDVNALAKIQTNYTSFNYTACVDYTADNLSKYGLDKPAASIDIGYYEATPTDKPTPTGAAVSKEKKVSKEYKIYIGNKDSDGNYYVRVDGSNAVYTLNADTVDKMLTVDTFSLVNHYVAIPNIETVASITGKVKGTSYTMEIKHNESSKDEDKTLDKFYYNGNKVKEDDFRDVYKVLISGMYDAQLKEKVDISKIDPYMILNFNLLGENVTPVKVSFLPYDENFYIVDKGTGVYFLMDKRKVDKMAKAISTFKVSDK